MQNDIITITDHIEIHPGANRSTGEPNGQYCVVRDGQVYGSYADIDTAREIADTLE